MRSEPLESISDRRLLSRLRELRQAYAAFERELAATVNEYKRRRIQTLKRGEEIEGPLAEVALEPSERMDLERAEAAAKTQAEADSRARALGLMA